MRFNSVLGAIVFIILTSAIAIVIFVQTKSFGTLLSRIITDVSEKQADTKVTINNIQISVLPPGIELVKVSVDKKFADGKSFEAELGTIGFYIGLIEIEERKLAFGEIRMSDSVIDVTLPENDDKEITRIDQEIIDQIFGFSKKFPIRIDTLLIENTRIHVNHDLMNIRRLKLFKEKDSFITRFHIANVKPSAKKDITIDEIWADAEINRNNVIIHRLKLQHDVHSVVVKGSVVNYPLLKDADVTLNGEGLLYLKALAGFDLPGPIVIESGMTQANFQVNLIKGKLTAESHLTVKDFRSNLAHADTIMGTVSYQDGNLLLSKMDLVYKDEKLEVLKPVVIAEFSKSLYLNNLVYGRVENLTFSNSLRILGPSFHPLKGRMSGKLTFKIDKGNLFFAPDNGFKIQDIALIVGDDKPFKVLRIKEAKLTDADFAVVNGEFQMSSMIDLPNSRIEIDGYVSKKEVKFSIIDGKVDLSDFGDISNLGILGKGILSMDVTGPLDDTDMNFRGQMAGFGVLGYSLGDSAIDLNLSLKDSTVTIKKLESNFGKTHISGNGAINYKSLDIALGINSPSASFHDLSIIMKPIVSKMNFLPEDFELNANIDAYIHGKTSLDKLKVKSHINFTDLIAYGENVNRGSFNIGFNNQVVSLTNFEATKDKGEIEGNFSLSMPTDKIAMRFNWDNLNVSSFNLTKKLGLNFDGYMVGSVEGEGKVKDYVLKLKNLITNTRSQNYTYPDSIFDLKIMPDRVSGDAQILGPVIQSTFDYSLTDNKKSTVILDVNMPDVKPFTVAVLGQHLDQEEFTGKLGFHLDMSFNQGFNHLDLKATLKELIFSHETFRVNYRSAKPQFLVTDSQLDNWNLNINEPDLFVMTKGNGTFGKNVTITNEFHINSKIAELFLSQVLSSEGFLRNIVKIEGRGSEYVLTANSKSENLSLSIEGAPFPINEMKYDVDYSNSRLVIKELQSNLESGSASLKGDVYFSGPVPDVNIKYVLDRAEFPILGKSLVNASGEGIVLGNELPYNVSGDIVINKGQIVNELSDFNNKSVAQVRYLPKNQESFLGKLFNLNLNIKAETPIRITNSLMDVALRGEVRLFGSPVRPRGEGRIFAPINSSRIFFKNNEYFITNADINFSPKKDLINPDFDVQAITYISSYKINAKAYGDLERFNFDLTSDPALPRNSILSLIAFGYTDEIQSTLTQGEQQNLTQVGVGSFVFDRFKITDILNKQFGLQVNLGTVFEQSQTQSMLSGRSQEGAGTLGRTRSATKIELKKRLDEALTLSVSSTMGGSIGQRQSMNLTYSVNKKVQVEGVYELRTNAEGEEDIISNSIGGDVKFRHTFP